MATRKARSYTDEVREKALAMLAVEGSLSRVSRKLGIPKATLHGWKQAAELVLTHDKNIPFEKKAEEKRKYQKIREEAKTRFVEEAWRAVFDSLVAANERIKFVNDNAEVLDKAMDVVASANIDNAIRGRIMQVLAQLANIPLKDFAIYIGTMYDKIALASGDVTARGEVKGQVTNRHEYDITQRIIGDPEAVNLAERLLRRAASRDAGPLRVDGERGPVDTV